MSIETWQEEFLPNMELGIQDACELGVVAAVEHCTRKWVGLQSDNLAKHKLIKVERSTGLMEEHPDGSKDYYFSGAADCALCRMTEMLQDRYDSILIQYPGATIDTDSCIGCPLMLSRNGVSCTDRTPDERESPWYKFFLEDDAKPMLDALIKTQQYIKMYPPRGKLHVPQDGDWDLLNSLSLLAVTDGNYTVVTFPKEAFQTAYKSIPKLWFDGSTLAFMNSSTREVFYKCVDQIK